ncbi:ditrans,polycis-polyprenyl diphosphate synthase [Ascoidea rubescens DSM 1968]|uniref:ditrans,polycis-polyprenyl diphosphate synthase [(2E,6E)-farnesyldiphosphate specific] n=1 Tax=Ascoidea rubescens DSM 1968 TaxID=1344418 RepID=A0A1D2VQP1_9ASCO|nr:Undecaprenyl diphosphate synthase [Ascoidea rubescens DSM 1968]ODV63933.1 Undecaprenyl diphosphate synthase [Ascoidea rubescens DSM 1968]
MAETLDKSTTANATGNQLTSSNNSNDNSKNDNMLEYPEILKRKGFVPKDLSRSTKNPGKTGLSTTRNLIRSYVNPSTLVNDVVDLIPGHDKSSEEPNFREVLGYYFFHSILFIMLFFFSFYRGVQYVGNRLKLRFLSIAYNPSKSPQIIRDDVLKLPKIPKRVSSVLSLKPDQDEGGGVEGLINDSSEITAWCVAAGIQYLSIYEYNGVLKQRVPELRRSIHKKLSQYFGVNYVPNFVVKVPCLNLTFNGVDDDFDVQSQGFNNKPVIEISLLSVRDGRSTIVDLTKTMADLAVKNELVVDDVTIDLVDKQLTNLVGVEPDLIILFSPNLDLQSYPPWHIRLSEIYWEPDNDEVNYSVFLRALQKYSTCKVNVGK